MIPARYSQIVFAFVVSLTMSGIISGISTIAALGVTPHLLSDWLHGWSISWVIAFPTLLVVAPLGRRITGWLTAPPG